MESKNKNSIKTAKVKKILSIIVAIGTAIFIFSYQGATEPKLFTLEPLKAIGLISIILSLLISLTYKYMTDQALMKELKAQLKKYQKQMKLARGDPQKVSQVSKKSMKVNMKYMSQSIKPMLVTIIPFILIFHWLRNSFDSTIVIPLSFWPGHLGWIGTYIILSMVFTTVFRKLLGVV